MNEYLGLDSGLVSVFYSVTASIIVNGVILFLLKTWITSRLTRSIEFEYKKQHEVFIRNLDRKDKIEIVSELLSEWAKYPPGENLDKEHRTKLNRLSFECTLWLSPKLSKALSSTLQREDGAPTIFDILKMARKELRNDSSSEDINVEHMTYWGVEKETQYK